MRDEKIIELLFKREEIAIYEIDKKYGKYCCYIANNILKSDEDTKECINDAYLKVWNLIPPEKPNILKLFLAKITRNLAINKWKEKNAKKRNSNMNIILEELDECIESSDMVDDLFNYKELIKLLNEFLENLSIEKRKIFLDRYWYFKSIKEISIKNNTNENNIKVSLYRMRADLKAFLQERGVVI